MPVSVGNMDPVVGFAIQNATDANGVSTLPTTLLVAATKNWPSFMSFYVGADLSDVDLLYATGKRSLFLFCPVDF